MKLITANEVKAQMEENYKKALEHVKGQFVERFNQKIVSELEEHGSFNVHGDLDASGFFKLPTNYRHKVKTAIDTALIGAGFDINEFIVTLKDSRVK